MSDCNFKVLVVGGVPEPVGGVTSFIYRLADNNMVGKIADIYPSKTKVVPSNFSGQVFFYKGVLSFLFALVFSKKLLAGITDVHFNFSRPKSLIIFLIPLLKGERRFHLTLHHGVLSRSYPDLLFKYLFSKFDVIYTLSEKQEYFYTSYLSSGKAKLKSSTSYVPMLKPTSDFKSQEIDEFIGEDDFVVISGYCSKIYNHDWVVRLFNEVELDKKLAIFLYGFIDSDYLFLLQQMSAGNARVKLFFNVPQQTFNFYLSRAILYIRPNSVDSFGIAVADAIDYGVSVLASDVCKRYAGSYLFKPVAYDNFLDAYLSFKKSLVSLPVQYGGSYAFRYSFEKKHLSH